jgi:hypothetical protein
MVKTLFQEDFLEIEHDDEIGCLWADWKGYQTDTSVKTGVNCLIHLMTEHQVYKILNDNTNTLGIWIGVASWLAFNALPRARAAGIKSLAHVYGPSRFSRISFDAALLLLNTSVVDIQAFDDVESARLWLKTRH